METVAIASAALAAIEHHAVADAPRECCGLLVGTAGRVEAAVPTRNIDASDRRFTVDPADHFALMRRLRGTSQDIVGAYHSHPHTAGWPSATDIAEAYDTNFLYVIVSLASGAPATRAFRIAGGVVTPVELLAE